MNASTLLERRAGHRPRAASGQHIHLLAGQFWFGRHAASLNTVLGSCIAVTLWHPELHLGGMCHFLLPQRQRAAGESLDGRFGDEAIDLLVQGLLRVGTRPQDYQAHLYGGADTMPDRLGVKLSIGERNIEQGWSLIERHGFALMAVDVGDNIPRNVRLTLATGEVVMRRGQALPRAA
jgi:chemotaxis protein CheD